MALRAHFDGKKNIFPKPPAKAKPGAIRVIFDESQGTGREKRAWLKAQEKSFAKVWNNKEDAAYDAM